MDEEKFKVIEQTAAPRILFFLKKNQKASRTELIRNLTASQTAIYNAIEILLKNELIQENRQVWKIDISLTEKGKKVADWLEELIKLL